MRETEERTGKGGAIERVCRGSEAHRVRVGVAPWLSSHVALLVDERTPLVFAEQQRVRRSVVDLVPPAVLQRRERKHGLPARPRPPQTADHQFRMEHSLLEMAPSRPSSSKLLQLRAC
eukprot:1914532-Rhodomonas_salina.2